MSNEKHDYLQIEDGAGTILERAGWIGSWPPPEIMCRVIGRTSRLTQLTEPENVERSRLEHSDFDDHVEVVYLQRVMASELPDDMDFSHVARGAVYTPTDSPVDLRRVCPEHGMTDCSPLLNGCSKLMV
jgi:hypothetical protein